MMTNSDDATNGSNMEALQYTNWISYLMSLSYKNYSTSP